MLQNLGLEEACVRDGYLRRSLTAYKGYLTHEETSGIQNRPWVKPEVILGNASHRSEPPKGGVVFLRRVGEDRRKPLISQSAVVISCIFMV